MDLILALDTDNASIKLNANYVLQEIITRIKSGEQHFYFRSSIIAACEILCILAADHDNAEAKALTSRLSDPQREMDASIVTHIEKFLADINQKITDKN